MKNRKGFTLIELIAVVVILGLIVLVAVPFFQGGLKTFRDDYYSSLEKSVINSAKDFFSDNRLFLPTRYLETAKVDLNTLNQEKYLKNVTDYEGNSCNLTESYAIAVKVSREKYEYAVCMKCEGDEYENTESVYCNKAWDNKYGHTEVIFDAPPKVYVYKGTSRDKLKEEIKVYPDIRRCLGAGNVCEEEIKRVSAEGEEGVRAIYPLNIDNVDTSKIGVYPVQYQYDEFSEEKSGEVEVYEHSPATISAKKYNYKYDTSDEANTVAKKKTKEVESVYDQNDPDDWAQKLNIKLNYNGSVGGTKVKVARYQWYVNNRWEDYCVPVRANDKDENNECNKTIGNVSGSEVEFNDTIKFRFIDVEGKVSKENSYKIRIDFTPPEACTLKLTGDIRNGWYYSSSVRIDFSHKDDNNTRRSPNGTKVKSEINYYGITTGKRLKNEYNTQTADTKNVTWYGYTEDKANNITVCSISFKKDSTAPECTDRGDNTKWTNSAVTVYWGCSDETSECATAEASQTFKDDGTFQKTWTKDAYDIYDNAGNNTTCPAKSRDIYFDKKKPTCTSNGDNAVWTNKKVTVTWGCADQDGASGCETAEDNQSFSKDNTITKTWTMPSYTIKDNAGNTETCPELTRNIYFDKKKPTCTSDGDNADWTTTSVTVTWGCADQDGGSGCKTASDSKTFKDDGTDQKTWTMPAYDIEDNAGNTESCPSLTRNIYFDKKKPTCTSDGDNTSWTNKKVTVTWGCSDSGSGCKTASDSKDFNTDGTVQKTWEMPSYDIEDKLGNKETCPKLTRNIYFDKIAPSCSFGSGSTVELGSSDNLVLTCTDANSGISNTSLAKTNFTLSNTNFSINTVTAGNTTNGKTFTLSMKADKVGSTSVTLNSSVVKDVAGNSSNTPSATMTGKKTYSLSYDCNGGVGTISASSCSFTSGTSCKVKLKENGCTRKDYDFQGWSTSKTASSGSPKDTEITLSANATYYATWKLAVTTGTATYTLNSKTTPATFNVTISKGYTSGTATATSTNGTAECTYTSGTNLSCTVKNMNATTPTNNTGCRTLAKDLGYTQDSDKIFYFTQVKPSNPSEGGVANLSSGCFIFEGHGAGFNSNQNWSCYRLRTTIFTGETDHCKGHDYSRDYEWNDGYLRCKCYKGIEAKYYKATVSITYQKYPD